MFALPLSSWMHRRGLHFGWVVAAVTFLTMLTSSAALGLPGALLKPLGGEFGWNAGEISSALALRFALFGLMGPFAATLMERYGLRRVVCTALSLLALGMLLSTRMTAVWQLVVLWGIVLGLGSGFTAVVLGTVVANRWFDKRRGLVIGMLTASSATGQLVFLPLAAWLVEHFGWRYAVFPVCTSCLITGLLAFCFLRDRPHELGIRAYGAPAPDLTTDDTQSATAAAIADAGHAGHASQASLAKWSTPFAVLYSVRGSAAFWILFGTFFICGLSTSGLIQTHFISLCGDFGLSSVPAASALAMMGAFDFFGTIASGWLSDRFDNRKLLFWYYGLRGLSLFWLPHSTFTLYGLSIFAMFYGLDWVATVPPTVKLTNAAFGKERTGLVFGWIFAGHQIGAAVAAYGAGYARTLLLTYTPALYAAGAACLVASVVVFLIKRPPRAGALSH
ncbi:MAG: MFS transporter [Janthinobacterium lividum]